MIRGVDPEEPWRYEIRELGFNYRMTELQAALGLSQLPKVPSWLERRREIASIYDREFKDLEAVTTPQVAPEVEHAWHLYTVRVPQRRTVYHALHERGIGVQVHYVPVHTQPYFREHFGTAPGTLPEAEAYADQALSLPIFPAMGDSDVERVVEAVREVIGEVVR